jgi:hypothetical protein
LTRRGASEALELALLQHAQELRLCGEAHLADLVEEQHTAGGELDLSGLGLLRTREGAALVAKELGLEQLLGAALRSSAPRTGRSCAQTLHG